MVTEAFATDRELFDAAFYADATLIDHAEWCDPDPEWGGCSTCDSARAVLEEANAEMALREATGFPEVYDPREPTPRQPVLAVPLLRAGRPSEGGGDVRARRPMTSARRRPTLTEIAARIDAQLTGHRPGRARRAGSRVIVTDRGVRMSLTRAEAEAFLLRLLGERLALARGDGDGYEAEGEGGC